MSGTGDCVSGGSDCDCRILPCAEVFRASDGVFGRRVCGQITPLTGKIPRSGGVAVKKTKPAKTEEERGSAAVLPIWDRSAAFSVPFSFFWRTGEKAAITLMVKMAMSTGGTEKPRMPL